MTKNLSFFLCAFILISKTLFADDPDFIPNKNAHINIPHTSEVITVDGELNDAGWISAAQADNFCENTPNDQTKPEVDTKVLVTYDNENLYVAFICYDDPSTIRVSLADRDNMWQDDYIGVLIDSYGNSTWGYYFFANAIGVQGDERYSITSGEDASFDAIYQSEGKITENGFQVEMAIPFSSMRFPDTDIQSWRINFWRNRPRENRYRYTWAAINRDDPCFPCQWGTSEGLKNIKSGSSVEFLPSWIGNKSGQLSDYDNPDSKFINNDIKGDVGLGFKWAATSSLTIEGTLNPDFSQVESDASQVDVNRTFALYFDERRPFFQEGSDLFETWHDIVYTRSLNNPLAATKVIGRWGNSTLAYMGAYDESTFLFLPFEEYSKTVSTGKSLSNIMRFKQAFGDGNHIGALVSDRRIENKGSITNYSIDGLYRLSETYHIEFQAVGSKTVEPNDTSITSGEINDITFNDKKNSAAFDGEKINGNAIYFSLEKEARHWSYDIDFEQSSPTFRAGNGFITQNNFRRASFETEYTFYYDDHSVFTRLRPQINMTRIFNYNGKIKDEWVNPGLYFQTKGQTEVEISAIINSENFGGKRYSDINRLMLWAESNFSKSVTLGMYTRFGTFIARKAEVKGKGFELELWSTIKPTTQFTIQPGFRWEKLDRRSNGDKIFSSFAFRTKFNYQFTRELALRFVVDIFSETNYDDDGKSTEKHFFLEPLLSYKLNPFTIFYIGSSHNFNNYPANQDYAFSGYKQTSRQYFMKFQYLFSL